MFTYPWDISSIVYEVNMICCRFSFSVLNLLKVREIKKKKNLNFIYKNKKIKKISFMNSETPLMHPLFRLSGKSKGHIFNNI